MSLTTAARRFLSRFLKRNAKKPGRAQGIARLRTFEPLERRELLAGLVISEVYPAGSGNGTYAADWFEVTNTGQEAVTVNGWKVDDSSNAFASALTLDGVATIAAGESVIFLETSVSNPAATAIANFKTAWFGVSPPAGLQVGTYSGSGVGLSASGDAVVLFDAGGDRITSVSFGTTITGRTFDNTTGSGGTTLPAISAFSTTGVNGGFLSANGAETGSPGNTFTGVDLSTYVLVAKYDLPEPTRTTPPDEFSVLAQEASAVTYNWDTDTLFVVGDRGTSIVQVSKTGVLIDSMTMPAGSSPQGTEFFDPEGLTYLGNGQFVMTEERDRQAVRFTYAAGTTLTRDNTQTVDLGTFVQNIGLEGLSYDPLTDGFLFVKEIDPLGLFQTEIDFDAGTATNGSATTENSTNLFDPTLLGLADFADMFSLANLSVLTGRAQYNNLLVLSQEDGKILNVDRDGNILSTLTITDPGNALTVPSQQHEGLTMDGNGSLYVVNENGGGDADHPQLWVYAPSSAPNQAPTALALNNQVSSLPENTDTTNRRKVADVVITDDGIGTNNLTVTGADAEFFEVDSNGLYIKAGTVLDYETKTSYSVTVQVNDPTVGDNPDASASYALAITDILNENPTQPILFVSEIAPWSSGNSPVGADWFEVTNFGTADLGITGWKVDDNSDSFTNSIALRGITTIGAGQSVIFIESNASGTNDAAVIGRFISTWFGGTAPAGLQIGTYGGSGIGLSTGGDAVNLYNAAGELQTRVTFGTSPGSSPFATFNNAAGLNDAAVTTFSEVGVNGALAALNSTTTEVGSPGTVGKLFISEVAPWSSGNSPVGADWFEVTNTTAFTFDLTGWEVDDNSESPVAAVALQGIASIAPGESVLFIETNDFAGKTIAFVNTWFGGTAPEGLQIGNYTGSGIGLSTGGDAVNLYDREGVRRANVSFGASDATAPFSTFDNAAGVNFGAISQLSTVGINDAFLALGNENEIGSPGTTDNATNDDVTTPEDAEVTFNVLANDAFPDADTLTVLNSTDPANGTLTDNGNGTFTYTPNADFSGADSFTYTAIDGTGTVAAATVNITVTAVNDAPVLAVPGTQTTVEDVSVAITGIAVSDVDVNAGTGAMQVTLSVGSGKLTVPSGVVCGLTAAQITGNGTAAVVLQGPVAAVNATLAAGITYLGNLNFHGTDTLTIVANDLGNTGVGGALSDSKLVSVRVLSPTEQVARLRDMVEALFTQNLINKGQSTMLFKDLESTQAKLDTNKTKTAYNVIEVFKSDVQSLIADQKLTPAQAEPLLTAADLLLQSLQIGGGF